MEKNFENVRNQVLCILNKYYKDSIKNYESKIFCERYDNAFIFVYLIHDLMETFNISFNKEFIKNVNKLTVNSLSKFISDSI